jgi:hypothetical protein
MGSNKGSQPERKLMIAGRVDIVDKDTIAIIKKYLVNISNEYIIVSEKGKKTSKAHLHFLLTKNSCQLQKSECDTIRTGITKLINFNNSKQYYVGGVRDEKKCFLYTLKDLDVIEETWIDRAEYDSMIAETIRINDEKNQPMKHQLVNHVRQLITKVDDELGDEYICPIDYQTVMKSIIEYHVSRDYLPPTPTMLLQYTIYACIKNSIDTSLLYLDKLKI